MAITVSKVFDSGQTDHQANPITLVLAAPIPVGDKALLCNASTIDASSGSPDFIVNPGDSGWGGIDTITDSRGNTWVRDHWTPIDAVNTFTTVEIWRSDISTALQNGDVVTVTGDTRGLSMEMGILDCSGLAPGAPTQKSAASNISGSTSWTSASITTSVANSLLVAVAGAGSGATAAGWWTPGGSFVEQLDRGDAGTIQRAVAIETLIVSATGTYTATGTANASSTGNMQLVAYQAANAGQVTGIGGVSLGPLAVPDSRTGHVLHVRARKANPTEAGVLRFWLYESNVLRSGPWDVGLTDTFVNSTVQLPDVDAATIGNYSLLELRFQGVSVSGAITPQLSFVELQTPGSSSAFFGASNFPAFEMPIGGSGRGGPNPIMFRPGVRHLPTDLSVPQTGSNVFQQALTAVSVAVTAVFQLQTVKAVTATAVAVTGTMVRTTNKALTATSVAVTGTLATIKVKLVAMTATAVAVTATMVRQVNKNLTGTAVAVTGSMVRQAVKALTAATVAVTATMARSVGKTLTAASVAVTASIVAVKAKLLVMTATAVAVTATMSRQVGKGLAGTSAVTATIARSVGKQLAATSGVTGTITRQIAKKFTATVVTTASMVAQFISGSGQTIYTKFFGKASPDGDELGGNPGGNRFDKGGPKRG